MLARVAVPFVSLSQNPIYPRPARAFGQAIAAGKMAAILRENPGLHGAALIEKFLSDAAVYLLALEGITDARLGGFCAIACLRRVGNAVNFPREIIGDEQAAVGEGREIDRASAHFFSLEPTCDEVFRFHHLIVFDPHEHDLIP